jgi:ubiquinone/menaquinone biosynthesis C-methylase UbiE
VDSKELQRAFHGRADKKRFQNRVCNPFVRNRERALAKRVAQLLPPDGKLLEIGCGEGSNLLYLREQVPQFELIGLDFACEKVAYCRESGVATGCVCADATKLPFVSSLFSAVLLRDLLHHIDWARDEVMAEAVRALANGGVLIVLESNPYTILNTAFRVLFPAERGMVGSTRNKLHALGARFGSVVLEPVEASFLVRAVGFVLGWPAGWAKLLTWPFYAVAAVWERVISLLLPKSYWTYVMMVVRPE